MNSNHFKLLDFDPNLGSDCGRLALFYTPQTIFNYSSLWAYAADAIFYNQSLCVQGSKGYASTGAHPAHLPPPTASSAEDLKVSYGVDGIVALSTGASFDIPTAFSGQEHDLVVPVQCISQ